MSQKFRHNVMRSLFLALWAMATVVLIAMVVLLVREIARDGRDPLDALTALAPAEGDGPARVPNRTAPTGTQSVQLYFASENGLYLAPEARPLPTTESTIENCRTALEALIAGPREGGAPILPGSATVKALYLLPQGELVINFSRELQAEYTRLGSVATESLFVQGVVHTLTQNSLQNSIDPKVRKVRILVEDAPPTEAFPAHIDLSEPAAPDAQWLSPQG